ncbi:DUF4148 domain-containing protein [Burkholderia vietnamiensis]|jgi:hypothetical protein|uniref:DUF4148 domain-containing protein n=2 Tax=Burkholderia vietnamiensis TaxID=60552 RepID=A4JQ77_BURVG|nr:MULTISPECIES: hypothetical protein [Burkholderia]ABO58430.1 conserved hypothetical protein [Burkholderia vietnamiensis G4]TPQ37817.1 hypothetical protein C2U71_25090 [Burkholderia ubonensis]AFJ89438.1 hypothetical protein MYA_5090 [Burkholderia sp. KJ006]AJY08443.1 hypothetical protein AK36_6074 [Burkholderia vietnamiensis LMG 10929]AOK02643.1 hypothetical protein WK23_28680 [Burkholderia vietnamiensis]
MRIQIKKLALAASAAAFLLGSTAPVFAQTDASAPAASTASDAKAAKHEARKAARAKRKAERKAARAKNTAELKKLEAAGYKPAANDPNYPQNLQNAQKKAAEAAGASQ